MFGIMRVWCLISVLLLLFIFCSLLNINKQQTQQLIESSLSRALLSADALLNTWWRCWAERKPCFCMRCLHVSEYQSIRVSEFILDQIFHPWHDIYNTALVWCDNQNILTNQTGPQSSRSQSEAKISHKIYLCWRKLSNNIFTELENKNK